MRICDSEKCVFCCLNEVIAEKGKLKTNKSEIHNSSYLLVKRLSQKSIR